jgi:WD40 repeat protein/serine/threonine protein kinase
MSQKTDSADHPEEAAETVFKMQTDKPPDVLNTRAVSLLELRKHDEAKDLWHRALKQDPHHPESVYNLGLFLWRSGLYTDDVLLDDIEQLRKTHPDDWRCDYFRGLVLLESGDCGGALQALARIKGDDANRKEIATALADAARHLEDSSKVLRRFGDQGMGFSCVCVSPDSRYVAAACDDENLRLWDVETSECLQTIPYDERVDGVSVSRDAEFLTTLSSLGTLKFWDMASGQCLHTIESLQEWDFYQSLNENFQENAFQSACLSSDGNVVLTGGAGQLRLWETSEFKCLHQFEDGFPFLAHDGHVTAVALNDDGAYALSAGFDYYEVKLWNVRSGECLREFKGHEREVNSVCFGPGGRVLSGSSDGTIRVWRHDSEDCERIIEESGPVHSVSISSDGRYAGSASKFRATLRIWDLQTGRCVRTLDRRDHDEPTSSGAVCFSRDGRSIVTSNSESLRLWSFNGVSSEGLSPYVWAPIEWKDDSKPHAQETVFAPTPVEPGASHAVGEELPDSVPGTSPETEWSDAPQRRAQETVFAETPVDLSASEAAVAEEWKAGDVILDLYEVKGVLGEGGFGKVYRVHHTGWNLDLAVKTPRIDRMDEVGKENFRNEAETWVNLGLHPHTVSCYYVRDLGGIPRVFAEYVEGGSLSDWIRTRELYKGGNHEALKRILDIAIQFAWGLLHAHEQGLVHQDVKPANVMMTHDGIAKITDFGLANVRTVIQLNKGTGDKSLEVRNVVMTRAYASPEQIYGKPVSRSTDIWSWAVSILEMFVGEVTWISGDVAAEVLDEFTLEKPEDDAIPRMPNSVRSLLQECFSFSPSDRPQDLMDVTQRLEEIYYEITLQTFTRKLPKGGRVVAASLNNRAVSMMDLGKQAEALCSWDEALMADPRHAESTYNRGLVLWRTGRIDDDVLIKEMEAVGESYENSSISDYLLGLVHLERGDASSSMNALLGIQISEKNKKEIRAALKLAGEKVLRSKEFEGHSGGVRSVTFSADGKYILSGSDDKTLKLWEVATGRCLRTFEGHYEGVTSVALTADAKYMLSGSRDSTLRLWEANSGESLRTFEGHTASIKSISLSGDGKYALSGSDDHTLRLWEVASGQCLRTLVGHSEYVSSVSLTSDGKHALSGSGDKFVKLWEVASGRCVRTFEGHTHGVECVSLSSDGKYALSGSAGFNLFGRGFDSLKLWEVSSGRCLHTVRNHQDVVAGVESVCLSADGAFALSLGFNHSVKFWEMDSYRCRRTFEGQSSTVGAVGLSADGRHAVSGDDDGTLKLWAIDFEYRAPMRLSQITASIAAIEVEEAFGMSVALAREALSNGDPIVAAKHIRRARSLSGCERLPEAIELWAHLYIHLPRRTLNDGWCERTLRGHTDSVTSISLSRDGKYVLSGSNRSRRIKLWEVASGQCLRTIEDPTSSLSSVTLSNDGKYALSGGFETLNLWEVASGRFLRTFKGHTSTVSSARFSEDGNYVLSGSSDKTLKLWESTTGRCLRTFEGHSESVNSVILNANGKYVLSGSGDMSVKLWDVNTGQCLVTFKGHVGEVTSISQSADGNYLLTGSQDASLRLWEVASGRCMRTFEGHSGSVSSISLSLNAAFGLSGSSDQTTKIWEMASGRCLRTFEGHTSGVNSVGLSAQGKFALTGAGDRTVRVWILDWELESRQPVDWDEGARNYLQTFLIQQTPYAGSLPDDREPTDEEITMALTRQGKARWSESDFQRLLYTLGCAGYGWLRPEGVRRELEKMAEGLDVNAI